MQKIMVKFANQIEREEIYKYRYQIYTLELKQHKENHEGILKDHLDEYNTYIIVKISEKIAGFISITPPNKQYSIDKYIERTEFPYIYENMFEGRILTVLQEYRGTNVAMILFYAAIRYIEEQGGTKVVAIGRSDMIKLYEKTGLINLDRTIKSGEVTFKLFFGEIKDMRKIFRIYEKILDTKSSNIDWQLGIPFFKEIACFHGGEYLNNNLDILKNPERINDIITADVLDAWFPPSPKVVEVLSNNLSLLIKTSPPVDANLVEEKIASSRNLPKENILIGAGSSDLIFLAFLSLLNERSKVLLLDPSYGEYSHILNTVIKCNVDKFVLEENTNFCIDTEKLSEKLKNNYDLVVLINPNNPTGNLFNKNAISEIIEKTNRNTLFWIDETYIDYAGNENSMEQFTKLFPNLIICKSLSKVFAFSGIRAGYLCSTSKIISKLKVQTPPWQVSFLSQIAVFNALDDMSYYSEKYIKTAILRNDLLQKLSMIDNIKTVSSEANFILCKIIDGKTKSSDLINYCKARGLYLRDVSNMGSNFNSSFFRIAVKDAQTNLRMLEYIRSFWWDF